MFSNTVGFTEGVWSNYFLTVSAARETPRLKRQLARYGEVRNRCRELELENARLRKFIHFQDSSGGILVAAKVIGRDPSPWSRTIMIDKGSLDNLEKGLPVLVSEGVVGQVVEVSRRYARVLLVTDRNSSVDALVQNSRARGIVQGNNSDTCWFQYALRKDEIHPDEIIVSSGLDGVFPKGLVVGRVVDVKKEDSQLFQSITIKTSVDFHKLEEVLVSCRETAADYGVK